MRVSVAYFALAGSLAGRRALESRALLAVLSQIGEDGRAERRRSGNVTQQVRRSGSRIEPADGVSFGGPSDLSFADHVHCFVALNGVQCAIHGSEPETGSDSSFNNAVILQ
jgi:hypothetical protein